MQFLRKPDYQALSDHCLKAWEGLYNKWQAKSKQFVLHDGPPYANGEIHVGHVLNKVLKDTVNRFMAFFGYKPQFILGWDCNGLPIESKVEKLFSDQYGIKRSQLKELPSRIVDFHNACRNYAEGWIQKQRESFIRLGVIADQSIYTTIDLANQISMIELMHKFAKRGLIYRSLKPVMWSCEETTALAEAEVEYKDKDSQAIDVLFRVVDSRISDTGDLFLPIWTTTPWTLPANRAVAFNKNISYLLVEADGRFLIIAESLLQPFTSRSKLELKVVKKIDNSILDGIKCFSPLSKGQVQLLHADFVTSDQGTGFVHIAPDHGVDDFNLCKDNNISCLAYLNDSGHYTNLPASMDFLENKFYRDVDGEIIQFLHELNLIVGCTKITHQYPHSWRSKKPLIYRATRQWFIDVSKVDCSQEIDKVSWLPRSSKERFRSTLKGRTEWCISRQRLWGTPIAMFYHSETGEILLDESVMRNVIKHLQDNGIVSWWDSASSMSILPPHLRQDYVPILDIVDVWFESGTTQKFILQKHNQYPADMYLEGSDQHRAWFQASMINGVFETGCAPYKCVKTHGYVLDKHGGKLSKSANNAPSTPGHMLDVYGPDVLRLWVLRQNSSDDIAWSDSQIVETETMYLKIRNTIKFLITHATKAHTDYRSLGIIEKWILDEVYRLDNLVHLLPIGSQYSDPWQLHTVVNKIYHFCDMVLSRLYFDIRKDVLYWEPEASEVRVGVKGCMHEVLHYLLHWFSPIIPFMTEEVWPDIHTREFIKCPEEWHNHEAQSQVEEMLKLRKLIYLEIEKLREAKEIKSVIDASVELQCAQDSPLHKQEQVLQNILIVSNVTLDIGGSGEAFPLGVSAIKVKGTNGEKCIKCKRVVQHVLNQMCPRCKVTFS